MLQEALEHLVRGIVSYPGDLHITQKNTIRGVMLVVRTNPDDVGKVIGRGGRTINALRIVVSALSGGNNVRVDVADKYGR